MQAVIAGGKARLLTRNGHDWTTRFPETAAALGRLPDGVLDGEIVAADAQGNPDFAALQAAMEQARTGTPALLCLRPPGARWREPVRPADRGTEDGAAVPPARRARDRRLCGGLRPARRRPAPLRLPDRARGHRLQACGVAPTAPGDRGGDWVKAKCRGNDEFVVVGHGMGAKGRMTLLLGARRGDALVYLGRVGSGIGERQERDLAQRLAPLRRAAPAVARVPAGEQRTTTWVEPQLVAEVDYAGWTADGLLRQAQLQGHPRGQAGGGGRGPAAGEAPPAPAKPWARASSPASA